MDNQYKVLIAIGLGLIGYLFWRQYENTDQQRYEYSDLNVIGMHDYGATDPGAGTGDHFLEPGYHCDPSGVVMLNTRFPRASGANGSLLITQGFGGLLCSKPQIADWQTFPPPNQGIGI